MLVSTGTSVANGDSLRCGGNSEGFETGGADATIASRVASDARDASATFSEVHQNTRDSFSFPLEDPYNI